MVKWPLLARTQIGCLEGYRFLKYTTKLGKDSSINKTSRITCMCSEQTARLSPRELQVLPVLDVGFALVQEGSCFHVVYLA